MYISQDLARINLGYKFIMYKHGPFSFDLKDELAAMRASNVLKLDFPQKDYGPSINTTTFGAQLYEIYREEIGEIEQANAFVAEWLATSDVKELEKVATAYFVTRKHPGASILDRAKRVNTLKPHVNIEEAEAALRMVDKKRESAKGRLTK
jgi:hypothetical protein